MERTFRDRVHVLAGIDSEGYPLAYGWDELDAGQRKDIVDAVTQLRIDEGDEVGYPWAVGAHFAIRENVWTYGVAFIKFKDGRATFTWRHCYQKEDGTWEWIWELKPDKGFGNFIKG